MFAALHAQQTAPAGTKITIAVKGSIGKCACTRMVQGGYNVAMGGGDTVNAISWIRLTAANGCQIKICLEAVRTGRRAGARTRERSRVLL